MKKKIICVLLLGFIFISAASIGFNVAASQDDMTENLDDVNSIVDITQDTTEESIMPLSSNGEDYSQKIENPLQHFKNKYPKYTWSLQNEKSTEEISNHIPINMQNSQFPKEDIQKAIIILVVTVLMEVVVLLR